MLVHIQTTKLSYSQDKDDNEVIMFSGPQCTFFSSNKQILQTLKELCFVFNAS